MSKQILEVNSKTKLEDNPLRKEKILLTKKLYDGLGS